MKEELISFKTAKLAKEKGFKEECLHFYCKNSTCNHLIKPYKYSFEVDTNLESEDNFGYGLTWSAPTQSLLQKWLREKCNIHITIWYNELTEKYRIDTPENLDGIEYSTYEQALEEGLYEALKLIP